MFIITYEKHDKQGNWTKHVSAGFSDYWLAHKEAALLSVNNANVSYVTITEAA